jgi:hypothetical protein
MIMKITMDYVLSLVKEMGSLWLLEALVNIWKLLWLPMCGMSFPILSLRDMLCGWESFIVFYISALDRNSLLHIYYVGICWFSGGVKLLKFFP